MKLATVILIGIFNTYYMFEALTIIFIIKFIKGVYK